MNEIITGITIGNNPVISVNTPEHISAVTIIDNIGTRPPFFYKFTKEQQIKIINLSYIY